MFSDKYIKIPIQVYNVKEQELTGHSEEIDSYMKFNPMEISNYKPSFEASDPDTELVSLSLKNGYNVLVYLSVIEFEKLINDHQK